MRDRKEENDKRAAEAFLNQKKQKEKEKKLLRKEKTRLRTLFASIISKSSAGISEDDVESLCTSLDIDRLRCLCDRIEDKEENERTQLLKDALNEGNSNATLKPDDKGSSANGSLGSKVNGVVLTQVKPGFVLSNYEKREKPWVKEEIELLRKGMLKYPKGTSRRWEVISEYIGTGRSVEEILKATKSVLLQKPDSTKAFDSFLEKRKPAQSIASPLTTRDKSDVLPAKGMQESYSEGPTKQSSSSSDGSSQNPQ